MSAQLSAPEPLCADHDLSAFACGEASLDDWLKRRALANQLSGASRTFAVPDEKRFVVGYYRKNPEFITLLNTENLHKGKHISKSMRAREYSSPAIEVIRRVLESGQAQGLFRKDVSARDVYLLIAATGYFYMSNRHTLSAFLGEDLETAEALAHWESFVIDSVLRTVAPGPSLPKGRVAAA